MAVRPKLGEYTAEKEIGTGALEKSYEYLKTSDPTAYYYNKLKHEKNEFLRDDMWNEAIRRGETQILTNLLSERQKISKGKEYSEAYKDLSTEGLHNLGIDALSKWESYGNTADYDGYMLALSIPTLDDSVKKPRTTDDGTHTFGDFTDREWANYVLENQFTYYDNLIIDEQKKNQNWLQQGWNTIVSLGGNIAVGLTNFVGDIYNIGEGLLNLIFNEGGDDDLGSRFLYAFSNDPENPLAQEMYEFHRRNLLMFGQEAVDTMTGEVTGFGKYWNGITESVGYMLPSILLNIALPGSGTPVFYAGIFSGNIKDTVTRAADAKISYKDLNAGSVIVNAGLKAAGQLVIEKLLGKILGASGLDKLIGTSTTVTKAGSKIAEEALATGGKAVGITASRVIKDMAKEGLEEALQDLSDGIIDIVFGAGGSELDKLYLERGQETTTWQNISDAFVMGALTTAMVGSFTGVFTSRAILTDADGKTYKAGLFQSLNFRNALATMNEWNNTVNDKKASTKAKTEAALNLSKAVSLLGSFTNNIGAVRAVRANNILNQMINVQATDAHIDNWLKTSYDNNYYNEFVSAYNNIVNQYKDGKNAKNKESIFSKVKTAISKVSAKLQKAKVTKTKSIITQDSTIEETNLSEDSLTRLKQVMKGLGAEVLIGTDGAIVTEADGVAFINNELINDTDSIIQGTTYDKVIDGVIDNMTTEQKEFLTEQYSKIVPSDEVTLEAAILALIRDNTFYTKLLLFSSDKKRNNTAISFLTNIYEIVKNRTIELEAKGEITKAAIKALLDRVLSTMRRGLVSYATKYVNYDINQLSDEVFPKELKDAVNNHKNVIYTKLVNAGLETSKNNKFVTPRDLESYDRELDKFSEYVDKEIIDTLKRKVRSNKKVERVEAWATLGILPKLANLDYDENKVIMLPVVEDSDLVLVEEYSAKLSDMFGASFTDIAKGIIDPNNFSEELISFMAQSPEYNLTTEIDRIELIRELVFSISNGQFTIDENFNFVNVLTKEQFLKSEYLTENGLNKLKEDIKSGNIKVLSDISKLKLPNKLKNTRIVYNPNVTNIPGRYDNVNNIIDLFSLFNISTILHEATHATQSYLISDKVIIAGGDSEAIWSALSQEDKTDISNYLETNFPDLFKILKNTYGTKFKTAKSMMYLMLEGELRANTISSIISPICGFTYENNRQILVSPLKDKKWNLSYKSTPIKQEIKKIETQAPLSIDKDTIIKRPVVIDKETNERVKKAIQPLIVDEKTKLAEVARIKKAVLYKGTGTKDIKLFDNTKGKNIRIVSNAIWFSDNPNVAQTYMRDIESTDIPTLYGANLDFNNPLVIDAKGQTFSQIQRGLTSDEVAAFAEYNNYDSLIILNIVDKGTYYKNVTDIASSRKPSTDVVIFDNKNIKNLKQKVYDKRYTQISDLTVDTTLDINSFKYIDNDIVINSKKLIKLDPNNQTELINQTVEIDKKLSPAEQDGLQLLKELKIHRLTPKDSFALMGVKEEDFNRIAEHQSENQLYHLAGDSIVVNVLQDIFDKMYKDKILTKPVRLIELFAGYGSQNLALKYSSHKYETWKIAEWAISSIQAYKDVHHYNDNTDYAKQNNMTKADLIKYLLEVGVSRNYNEPMSEKALSILSENSLKTIYNNIMASHNLVNIKSVTAESLDIKDTNNYDYIVTYSFPCQDLSQAGKRLGMKSLDDLSTTEQLSLFKDATEETGKIEKETRSSMIWEVGRILDDLSKNGKEMPKVLLMENVPTITNKSNEEQFAKWRNKLSKLGYTNSVATLSAADYGIPQKRVRTFMVSILDNRKFVFPQGKALDTKMLDLVEKNPDSKYYLTDKQLVAFMSSSKVYAANILHHPINQKIASTLTTSQSRRAEGGNFIADRVNGEMDLFKLVHGKDMDGLNKAKSKLAKGENIKAESNQYSIFDLPVTDYADSDIFIKGIKPKEGTKLKSYDTTIKSDQLEDIRTNIDTAKAFDKVLGKTRYITNKRANLSNLKYFVKKGVPIQMHPGIADFIEGTTNEFEKLPIILKDKIKNGTLNKFNLLDYLATANNIDDFTFKSIAKYIFRNSEVEKITYKDMKRLFNQIEELATISYLTKYPDKQMTPTELFNKLKVAWNKLEKEDKEFTKKYKDASEHSISIFANDKKSEAHADTSQLQIAFFRIYDGSLKSIRDLNNYGKLISAMQDPEILDLARYDEGTLIESGGTWNWTDSQKAATIAYKYDEAKEILNELSREDKLEIIKDYLINSTSAKLAKQSFTKEQQLQIAKGLQERLDKIEEASDAEIDKRYLMIIANEGTASTMANKPSEAISKLPLEKQEPSKKNIKDQLRKLGKTITKRIAGLKYRYNLLSEEVKKYIDSKTYTLNDEYKSLAIEQLATILPMFQEAAKVLKSRITNTEIEARIKAEVEKRVAKFAKKLKGPKEDKTAKKTIREKIEVKHTTKIINQEFVINSPIELTKNDNPDIMTADKLVHAMLNTNWEKYTDSEVKGVDTKDAKSVAAIKDFFTQNTDTLLSADLNTIEEVSRWFLNTTLNNASDEDFRQFNIIKQYFLEYVLTYSKTNKIYEQLNANLKQQIDNWVEKNASLGGTSLAIHNNMLSIKDPLREMRALDMIIDSVKIEGENKEKLFEAIESGDIKYINEVTREITEYVESNKTAKHSFARKVVSFRSMSMLSGPLTWLRNRVSNIVLKRLNKLSSLLGNKMFKGKSQQGQLKLTAQITPEIQKYIVDNFVDNEFFDKIVSNISKYNPSDIQSMKQTDLGVATKEAVLAQLVIKSMYNEYYNKNTFKSKFMNQIHNMLMKVMSDDTYVREATIRYFGKLLAENNRQLDQGITDEVMNDFARALGLALSDYMHSENFFNKWENVLAEKSEAGWFLYKTILPFASASWNWFKAMIKMSPIGLARSIINITTLEKRIAKAEQLWQEGKTQISPELTEYIARRDLGQGVIGTIAFILGVALAAIGFIQLDDDDYGNPKLTVGPLKIDISSIFGSSSVLAGAALVTGFKDEGSFNEALNRTLDVMLDNFPIMQILELDMYSNGSWDIITSTAESTALSFIPNFISYIAGATYSGNVKKDTFWRRAIAKIPVLANVLPKKVDPYTGSTGSYIDALNRIIPYLSIKVASDNERKTTELGLNKTMLRGQYSINGEEFNVTGKDLDTINKLYGQWNATDLTKFYDNKMKVEVKVGNTYKVMSYNQMDDIQRKAAVQTIMSNNAELAKIYAWTIAGNKYYASETIYNKLKKNGIHKNVYRGSQGFVKKK